MKLYLLDQVAAAELTANKKAAYEETPREGMAFEQFACYAIATNIKAKPIRYRGYGPYWWALKRALIENGYDFGVLNFGKNDSYDKELAALYSGRDNEQTIVLADAFWHQMAATVVQGTNQFTIDDSTGETFTLYDEDMESLVKA